MKDIIKALEFARERELPGLQSQLKMAPRTDFFSEKILKPGPDAKRSAVLIILVPGPDRKPSVVLTLRSKALQHHSGQISFPGGMAETDETPEETALREAREEIGLNTSNVSILGRLTELYVFASKSIVTPVVAWMPETPKLTPNDGEVEEILLIPLEELISGKHIAVERWNFHGSVAEVPFWKIHATPLWGATAMILSELLDVLIGSGVSFLP